jgi:hypothetical protein
LKREKGVDDWPGMTFTRETTMDDQSAAPFHDVNDRG